MSFIKKAVLASLALIQGVNSTLDTGSSTNIAVYWAADPQGVSLKDFCSMHSEVEVVQLSVVSEITSNAGVPKTKLGGVHCANFPGTELANCPKLGSEIKYCQDQGKTVLLSIGGASSNEKGFDSEFEAKKNAEMVWKMFGPKASFNTEYRPFGDTAVDGFDFETKKPVPQIEVFAGHLRELMNKADGEYFLTAAPQCPFMDKNMANLLEQVSLDAVFVQFYNHPECDVNSFASGHKSSFNFREWDSWARSTAANKKVKVLVGAPASPDATRSGYADNDKLNSVIKYSRQYSTLGGLMFWDATHLNKNEKLSRNAGNIVNGHLY